MKPKSSIPGRIRWQHGSWKNKEFLQDIKSELESLKGVYKVNLNVRAGSVLVHYDPLIDPADFVKSSGFFLDLYKPTPLTIRSIGKAANRISKIGSLAALGLTFASIAAKKYKFHGQMGYLFLGLLSIHVILNRKTLFK